MKKYHEAIVKDAEKLKKEFGHKTETGNGMSNGVGEEAEDFAETEDTSISSREGEEAGDFMGDGSMEEGGDRRKMPVANEPEAGAGKIQTDPDYSKIETGTTGSNVRKDYKQEKAGSRESEKERETNMRNPE